MSLERTTQLDPTRLSDAEAEQDLLNDAEWVRLSSKLNEHEQDLWPESARSDAEFIVSLRAAIEDRQTFVPGIMSSGWRVVMSLAGVGVAVLAILLYVGRFDPVPQDVAALTDTAYTVLEDESVYLDPLQIADAGTEIIPELLAAQLGVAEVLEVMDEPAPRELITDDLLALDQELLAVVMEEFESTQFF